MANAPVTDEAMRRQADLPAKHRDEATDTQARETGEVLEIDAIREMPLDMDKRTPDSGIDPGRELFAEIKNGLLHGSAFLAHGADAASSQG
jgi:hypothetical protein